MAKDRIGKPSINRWRVLQITFDLTDTVPGDRRYQDADDAMATHGELFKPIKQVRFLLTNKLSGQIRDSIEQRTGRITIMISPFSRAYQLRVTDKKRRKEMRRFLGAVRDKGLDTSGFEDF